MSILSKELPGDSVGAKQKLVIYQLFVRTFGNKKDNPKFNGSIDENGCGKFNDINEKALLSLKKLGVNCVWYTGVISQATMTDYTNFGIQLDDPDVVKGSAGSPYAIKDYYDVSPDLAENIPDRMTEFEQLVERTHSYGLKVLIDFVPNHVARTYHSDTKPSHIEDLGEADDVTKAFDPTNDFYYIPDKRFEVPKGYDPGGNHFQSPLKDSYFHEYPAKATGNDVFSATPEISDWFETIKLNYGTDYTNGKKHFVPNPPLWKKMVDILLFWASKGVDGFRCDMVEMVPVEFWNWAISAVKKRYQHVIFIGEAYQKNLYEEFLFNGKFDYLYDKVGLYDSLRRLIVADHAASVNDILSCVNESREFNEHLLLFLENHDEQRIASSYFAGNPWLAVPAMIVTATLSTGPVMIYNGQEIGENSVGTQGFSGDDGRTSIFDYSAMPQHQKWMNSGEFDGGGLSDEERVLRGFYGQLLCLSNHPAISTGVFSEVKVTPSTDGNQQVFAYLRYIGFAKVMVVVNFSRTTVDVDLVIPRTYLEDFALVDKEVTFKDLLSLISFSFADINNGLRLLLPPTSGVVLEF